MFFLLAPSILVISLFTLLIIRLLKHDFEWSIPIKIFLIVYVIFSIYSLYEWFLYFW